MAISNTVAIVLALHVCGIALMIALFIYLLRKRPSESGGNAIANRAGTVVALLVALMLIWSFANTL